MTPLELAKFEPRISTSPGSTPRRSLVPRRACSIRVSKSPYVSCRHRYAPWNRRAVTTRVWFQYQDAPPQRAHGVRIGFKRRWLHEVMHNACEGDAPTNSDEEHRGGEATAARIAVLSARRTRSFCLRIARTDNALFARRSAAWASGGPPVISSIHRISITRPSTPRCGMIGSTAVFESTIPRRYHGAGRSRQPASARLSLSGSARRLLVDDLGLVEDRLRWPRSFSQASDSRGRCQLGPRRCACR
jgi:hypothetical protein